MEVVGKCVVRHIGDGDGDSGSTGQERGCEEYRGCHYEDGEGVGKGRCGRPNWGVDESAPGLRLHDGHQLGSLGEQLGVAEAGRQPRKKQDEQAGLGVWEGSAKPSSGALNNKDMVTSAIAKTSIATAARNK